MLPAFSFQSLKKRNNLRWIDLRSPSEYATDHVPWAENVPLFNDEQRAVVNPAVRGEQLRKFEPLIRERTADVLDALPIGEEFNWQFIPKEFVTPDGKDAD